MSAATSAPAGAIGTVLDERSAEGARAYAEALLNVAEQDENPDEVLDEIDSIVADVLVPNPRFAELIGSSTRAAHEKDRSISDVFDGRARPLVVRFLRVLNRNGRLGLLATIAREARALRDRRAGRKAVTVRSAIPLDDDQKQRLGERLAALTGAAPVVRYEVDPALIGGLVVQVGDDLYDTSVRQRLEQVRRRLVATKTREIQEGRARFLA